MGEIRNADEVAKSSSRPLVKPTAILAVFLVHQSLSPELYIERLRALISAAVSIAQNVNFDEDSDIAFDSMPEWFPTTADMASRKGARNYVDAGLGDIWDPEEWIYTFDPDLRAWTWWDATVRGDSVAVWIDTLGEPHVPHEELLWALYVSGAERVDPLYMEDATVWVDEIR
ncbi:hypothetical protein ACFO5K_10735 [Nocardia halotolerans]|uniref:Uncharacterized protein n=1 Tax=Nocardia halotolerans TaxID=1755878 RepID=A0ABV8VH01_9NOCA